MQGGYVHYTFQPISRILAIQTMVGPPQLHHCWDSHFVPCKISGTLAILTMVDPPNFTIVEIAILFLVQFPELWLFLQW